MNFHENLTQPKSRDSGCFESPFEAVLSKSDSSRLGTSTRVLVNIAQQFGGHRSWMYCSTRPMHGEDGASPEFLLPVPKINLIYGPRVGDVSDIKLIRTDTTLDLSQKAEKRCPSET